MAGAITSESAGVLIIDPLIKAHSVQESDNGAMDQVMTLLSGVARRGRCAVLLLHHLRKGAGGAGITGDDGRGAGAINAAARAVRTARKMTNEEAETFGIESNREDFFREEMSKTNLGRLGPGRWYQLADVLHPNGTKYPVADMWTPPEQAPEATRADLGVVQERIAAGRPPKGEPWRSSVQAGDAWAGHAVADVLGLDLERPRDKARVRRLLARWLKEGWLDEQVRPYGAKGKTAPFIVAGRGAAD
jgi:hypothetical protein